jgi:hypothetical protein
VKLNDQVELLCGEGEIFHTDIDMPALFRDMGPSFNIVINSNAVDARHNLMQDNLEVIEPASGSAL